MAKVGKKAKEFSVFNFDNLKNNVNEYNRKIKNLIDDQIKCLNELEAQFISILNDEKVCILAETPTQKRKRLFVANDITASSPLREISNNLGFCSVIQKTPRKLEHFEKTNCSEIPPISRPQKRRTSIIKSRKLLKNSEIVTPAKIKRTKINEISSNSSQNIENKEKRRLKMLEVEQRRRAIEEERIRKLVKKEEKPRVIPSLLTPKPKIPKPKQEISTINESVKKRETFDFKTPVSAPKKSIIYKITPEYVVKKPAAPPVEDDFTSYAIDDIKSDDDSDEEEKLPTKPIPKWAQDKQLWLSVVSQNKDVPINGEQVFGPIPDVTAVMFFVDPSSRYKQRTSSAFWDSTFIEPVS